MVCRDPHELLQTAGRPPYLLQVGGTRHQHHGILVDHSHAVRVATNQPRTLGIDVKYKL